MEKLLIEAKRKQKYGHSQKVGGTLSRRQDGARNKPPRLDKPHPRPLFSDNWNYFL